MAGHSKWANIQHRKSAIDAKRGKLFTRLIKEVTVAARLGGGDPAGNPRLRAAIQEARGSNVPSDNIERAIKKATGNLAGQAYEACTFEGYAPGGVAVLVEAVTDNRNRTVSEVRNIFSYHGGSLGESGCVAWMFERRGCFTIGADAMNEEAFMELALELGADDIATEEDGHVIYTSPEDYTRIREELEARQVPVESKELAMIPQNYVPVAPDLAPQVLRLAEALEDHDDVQSAWFNFELTEQPVAAPAS